MVAVTVSPLCFKMGIRDRLGGAIDAGVQQHLAVQLRFAQVQAAGILVVEEVEDRQQAAHDLAEEGGNGGTLYAPAPDAHRCV